MRILPLLAAICFFVSCDTKHSNDTTLQSVNDTGRTIVHTDTVYITRNEMITPANSYSDLFLDSSTVEQFIQTKQLSADDAKGFRSFYNYRNLQFAWFTSLGFTEQAKGFWNLQDKFNSNVDKALRIKMDTLLNGDTVVVSRFDTSIMRTELELTHAYLKFYKLNRDKTQFANISPEQLIPVKKENALTLADTILQKTIDTNANKTARSYILLKEKLQLYRNLISKGGWITISANAKQLKKGSSSPGVTQLKKRLQQSGELAGNDTTNKFTDTLVMAIKNYQQHNGLKPTGFVSDTLIKSLNVPVEKRLQQIIINLNRIQWMPVLVDENRIAVNIPDFMLTVYDNNALAFNMPVAVGKEGTSTTMFTGDLNQIVFSPYWHIPASIVQREILPKMQADPNYLKSKNMEIVGENDGVPTIRQLPGGDNALGKVKFLFPNRYDIYFHDTKAKEIFNMDKRAVSHGCIRLQDPGKLATYLLRNNNSWTADKVDAAMNASKEQYVKLSPAMPVLITYYTAWVDEEGQLNFRDDVYMNDQRMSQMLFANTASGIMPSITDTSAKKINAVRDTATKKIKS